MPLYRRSNGLQPHIFDLIAAQGWEGTEAEIFMGLKEGSLQSLGESGTRLGFARELLHQMLQALACLASNRIIHRDVKPQNILYTIDPEGQYQFQLGDFGLCNRDGVAKTCVETPFFMAPEIIHGEKQTHKVDVWSLFITFLWLLDIHGFRQMYKDRKNVAEIQKAVSLAVSQHKVAMLLGAMAVRDPEKRASATVFYNLLLSA